MTKRQHPKDESGSEKTEEQTSPEDSQPQKNPKDKSDEHEMHKSSHYHQHHDTTSNYKHPHWAGFYSKNSLILTFSPREKELAILIALPVNDHLLIYERYLMQAGNFANINAQQRTPKRFNPPAWRFSRARWADSHGQMQARRQ